jgi:hypothetical protein
MAWHPALSESFPLPTGVATIDALPLSKHIESTQFRVPCGGLKRGRALKSKLLVDETTQHWIGMANMGEGISGFISPCGWTSPLSHKQQST